MGTDFFAYSHQKIAKDKADCRCDVANNRGAALKMSVQILRQGIFDIRRAVTRNDDTVQRMAKSQWTQGINRPSQFVPDSYPLQRSGERNHCPTSAVAEWHKATIAIQTEVRVAY